MKSTNLHEIPEKRQKSRNKGSRARKNRNKSNDPVQLSSNMKDIEKRILMKMKERKNNKTDRESQKFVVPTIKKSQAHFKNRVLHSPGSDKADNSFPKLANSSITSAYSMPYGKNTDKDTDLRMSK